MYHPLSRDENPDIIQDKDLPKMVKDALHGSTDPGTLRQIYVSALAHGVIQAGQIDPSLHNKITAGKIGMRQHERRAFLMTIDRALEPAVI